MAKQDPHRSPHSEQGSSSPASGDRRVELGRRPESDSSTRPHNPSSGTQATHRSRTSDTSTSSIFSESRFRESDEITIPGAYVNRETRGSDVQVNVDNNPQQERELEERMKRIERKYDVIWKGAARVQTENTHQWSTEDIKQPRQSLHVDNPVAVSGIFDEGFGGDLERRTTSGASGSGERSDPEVVNTYRWDTVSADDEIASLTSSAAPSIFSAATGSSAITTATQYSGAEIASATQQFVDILCKDKFLNPLYKEAIQSETIGAERFCRNFRRLLRIYSKELKEEAGESQQYLAARFVQWKARPVAELIMERYTVGKPPSVNRRSQITPAVEEEDSAGEEQPGNFQEDHFKHLLSVADFLTNGAAFENLKANFEKFVSPSQSRQRIAQPQEESGPISSAAAYHRKGKDLSIMGFIAMLKFMERPLEPGKQRIRWKCRCGKQLYDDYTELEAGALEDLRKRLEHLNAPSKTPGNRQGHNSTASEGGNRLSALMNSALSLFYPARKNSSTYPQIPLYNKPAAESSSADNGPGPQPDPLHLLICMKDGRFGTSLYQEEICGLKNDRELFAFLRDDYMRRRGKLYSLTSLQAPEGIKLVKFNLVSGKFVDVRKHELDCVQECICLPPPKNVEPELNAEYRCMPIPPSLCPPIGSELLMHLFSHPECLEDEEQAWILAQFPKKLHGELVRKPDGPVAGWGIHFEEGWNWDRIRRILFVYIAGSLVFGVSWTVRRNDMQGAFGVAGYWVSTATVFLGYVAMRQL